MRPSLFKDFRYSYQVLGLTVLCFLSGKLGLLLAIPPGYATPIWPPAGIALAVLIVWGRSLWPGVLIGSWLLNLSTSADLQAGYVNPAALITPLLIALGSTLQAVVGATVVRKFIGDKPSFHGDNGALKFVALTLLNCTIAATLGVTTLYCFNLVPASNFSFSLLTWWLGDSVGALLLAPVLIAFFQTEKSSTWTERLRIVVPLAILLCLTILIYSLANNREQERLRNDFQATADNIAASIRSNIQLAEHDLLSMQSFYRSSSLVDESEFRTFAKNLLKSGHVQRLTWVPWITDGKRNLFEQKAPGTNRRVSIYDLDPTGRKIPSPKAQAYLPILFVEPEDENGSGVGLNVFFDKDRKELFYRAIDSGNLAISKPLLPLFGSWNDSIVLLAQPVFENDAPTKTIEDRRTHIKGFVTGVAKVRSLMHISMVGHQSESLNLLVEEVGKDSTHQIYRYRSEASANYEKAQNTMAELNAGISATKFLQIADVNWKVTVFQTQEYLAQNRSWSTWFVLLAGLVFTALFSLFIISIAGRQAYTEELIRKKGEEITSLNAKMFSMSKLTAIGEMAGGIAHEINTPLAVISFSADLIKLNVEKGESADHAQVVDALARIESTVFRINKIITGLLAFSREADGESLVVTPIAEIITDTVSLCEQRFHQHNIRFQYSVPAAENLIRCRPNQIVQVLINLLNNSFDAVREQPDKKISLNVQMADGQLVISIIDNGPGIPAEIADKIFNPFFSTKPVGSGTGLGLSISSGIAVSHGGRLEWDHRDRKTTFRLFLPLAKTAA